MVHPSSSSTTKNVPTKTDDTDDDDAKKAWDERAFLAVSALLSLRSTTAHPSSSFSSSWRTLVEADADLEDNDAHAGDDDDDDDENIDIVFNDFY